MFLKGLEDVVHPHWGKQIDMYCVILLHVNHTHIMSTGRSKTLVWEGGELVEWWYSDMEEGYPLKIFSRTQCPHLRFVTTKVYN